MKHLILCAIAGALLCTPAWAQPQQQRGNGNGNNFGAQNGAVFQLPRGVQNVVSIDALNMIIIASNGEREGETVYTPTIIQHVYSGGIARLFGGTAVPTAQFATPGLMNGGGNSGNNGVSNGNSNGFGGQNNGGNANGFGSNSGFNNGGGFGNGGLGGQNNGATFQNGVLGGNGFNTQNTNIAANARVRAR